MATPSLAMIPSGYKDGKVYSVLPANGDGDFTFSRGSSATRVNEDGLIETVTGDMPRLDYTDSSCPSLLLEPQSLNSQNYSEDLSSGFLNGATSGLSNVAISPDGTLNADKLVESNTNARHELYGATISFSGTTSVSFFAKAAERKYISVFVGGDPTAGGVTFDVQDGIVSLTSGSTDASIVNYGNGWYRCSLTSTNVASSRVYYCLRTNASAVDTQTYQGDGTSGMYLWGFQTEIGQSYPTSYIPTSGTTITRLADTATGAGTSSTFNDSEGVFYAEIAALANDLTNRRITIDDGTGSNRITLGYYSASNSLLIDVASQGTGAYTKVAYVPSVANFNKIAIKYKENDFALWINGLEVDVDVSGITPINLNNLKFDGGGGATPFYGKVKDVRYYNTALTDEELQALTS